MAPMASLGRDQAIKLVEQGKLPVWFGAPHPTVAIVEQDGAFRIRGLVIDEAEAREIGERALANRQPWTPEQYYALGKPTGTIYAEARTRAELIARMRTMDWPAHW